MQRLPSRPPPPPPQVCKSAVLGGRAHGFSHPLSLCLLIMPLQLCQSSPGAQSSCSSEPSPLGSAPNNDSGVEMPGTGPGSLADLTALEDPPPGADTSALAAPSTGGLQLRKHMTAMHRFEQLKKEKLKSLKDSCSWAGPAPHTRTSKLPPLLGSGKWRPQMHWWGGREPRAAQCDSHPPNTMCFGEDSSYEPIAQFWKLRSREVKVLCLD